MEWIEAILILNGVKVDAPMRNAIADAIKSMSETHSKTLSEFTVTVQNNVIREALKQYTIDGNMGHLLDGRRWSDISDFMTFEIEHLMNMDQKYRCRCCSISSVALKNRWMVVPTLIFDEVGSCWVAEFRAKSRDWLNPWLRNYSVLVAAQQ